MFIVYVLQSKKDASFYIGFTSNIQRRIDEHNAGSSLSTKSKRPWELIYCEIYRSRKDAAQREIKLKGHKNAWLKLKERIRNSIFSGQN
jgi:putative endonuclease